jgi:DNA-binding PucR family transcriptional regulator
MSAGAAASVEDWQDQVRRQTAIELRPSLDDLVSECVRFVQDSMPELDDDEELAAGLYESARDNLDRIFTMLSQGRPASETIAPPGAIRYAEIMVRRGTPLASLLRAYRLGTMWFWTLWRREIIKRIEDPELLMQVVDHSMSFVFDYVDVVSNQVTEEYATQRSHWARSAAALRQETVQELLTGAPVDLDVASSRLGYDLRGSHIALILWTQAESDVEDSIACLEKAAHAIAKAMHGGRPLLVPDGRTTLWAWLPFERSPDDAKVAELDDRRLLDGACAAAGTAAAGREGFVTSHDEALQVRELLRVSGRSRGHLVQYDKVVVASLLAADIDRAERFIRRELGELAGHDDSTTRIRATVQVLLEESGRTKTAARRLSIHQNTVAYRVRQAEELLGHPLTERRFEVETALRLQQMLAR